jgi:hypothetical protein
MSIITTYPAVPSRLFSIYAALSDSADGELRDQLEAWSTPPSLATRGSGDEEEAESSLFISALQEARRLGIVDERDGRLRIVESAREGKKRKDREADFRADLCKVLFDPVRAGQADHGAFMLALSWFLSKDPLEPLNFSEAPQEMLRKELGDNRDKTELTNQSRYQNFLYWARYLGFATFVGFDTGRRVFPDPTRAIAGVLPKIFGEAPLLEIESFLSALSEIFPVFEGGTARGVLDGMRTEPFDNSDRLSIATSLALQRLADRREIGLEAVADARGRILDFGVGTKRISRIRRGGAE